MGQGDVHQDRCHPRRCRDQDARRVLAAAGGRGGGGKRGGGGGGRAATPVEGRPGQAQEWEWRTWFDRVGAPGAPRASVRYEDIGPAITAAVEGAGVVIARSLLVQDALADGRLVRALDPRWDLPSSKVHTLSWPAALIGDDRVRAFAAWLLAEARRSSPAPA
ncbi:MAG: LysR substrate-binding domain-containing protein [Elsteraceae bacterium]